MGSCCARSWRRSKRPYLQAALRPFTGNKAAQLEALRARIRRPLSLVEAALRGPVG